jgi:hypothetical protein
MGNGDTDFSNAERGIMAARERKDSEPLINADLR